MFLGSRHVGTHLRRLADGGPTVSLQRTDILECGLSDLHFSHTNPTEMNRNQTCEKQKEF